MLKLSGRRPNDLGANGGRFSAAPTWKPNWVSSQVDPGDRHYVAPFPAHGGAAAAMQKLASAVRAAPRATIVEQKDGYLYAEFSTPLMGFVDDVEFVASGEVIHVRSSSRLGIRDFDVNRKRVEALRAQLA